MNTTGTTLEYRDLIAMPVNAMFYRIEPASSPVFVKLGDCAGPYKGKDIRVSPLQPDNDGPSRLGLFEMDQSARRSARWHRLNEEEINTMIGRLMLAAPSE